MVSGSMDTAMMCYFGVTLSDMQGGDTVTHKVVALSHTRGGNTQSHTRW